MEFSAQPSMFASRDMRLSGATSGAPRGRRSCSRRLRRLLERRRGERLQQLPDGQGALGQFARDALDAQFVRRGEFPAARSEEHTSELQSQSNLVCRLLLEKKKNNQLSAYCA